METIERLVIPFILIPLLVVVLLLVYYRRKDQNRTPNYRVLFIVGISWIPLGIATANIAFTGAGLLLMIVSLVNRKKWKKIKKWSELTIFEKRVKIILLSIAGLLLIAGIVAFFVYN